MSFLGVQGLSARCAVTEGAATRKCLPGTDQDGLILPTRALESVSTKVAADFGDLVGIDENGILPPPAVPAMAAFINALAGMPSCIADSIPVRLLPH